MHRPWIQSARAIGTPFGGHRVLTLGPTTTQNGEAVTPLMTGAPLLYSQINSGTDATDIALPAGVMTKTVSFVAQDTFPENSVAFLDAVLDVAGDTDLLVDVYINDTATLSEPAPFSSVSKATHLCNGIVVPQIVRKSDTVALHLQSSVSATLKGTMQPSKLDLCLLGDDLDPVLRLSGTADPLQLDTTRRKITGYTNADEAGWVESGFVDAVAGEIRIPVEGIYQIIPNILGEQGNTNKEEQMFLYLRVNAADSIVDERDVPTDKTRIRSLGKAFPDHLYANDTLSLWMDTGPSGNLGQFTFTRAALLVYKLSL